MACVARFLALIAATLSGACSSSTLGAVSKAQADTQVPAAPLSPAATLPVRSRFQMQALATIVSGTEPALARFEEAARTCGAQVVSIEREGETRWVGIARRSEPPANDARIMCALRWLATHRDGGLYFVGGKAE